MKYSTLHNKELDLKKPPIKHLIRMTTEVGMLQHSLFGLPDLKYGYSIDDNARALIVCLSFQEKFPTPFYDQAIKTYFRYIKNALTEDYYFHNFLDIYGNFLDDLGSEDSFGRTIWALSALAARQDSELSLEANDLIKKVSINFSKIKSLRARAFLLLGFSLLGEKELCQGVADQFVALYQSESELEWNWFEGRLTYSNAILPLSLLQAHSVTKNKKYLEIGLLSLDFLIKVCQNDGLPAPIGQDGWHEKNGVKNIFDQQLIDVADMVLAAKAAYDITGEEKYFDEVLRWFSWFSGNNINSINLFDPKTEGCFDGVNAAGVNQNQGAESILAYLLAYNYLLEISA